MKLNKKSLPSTILNILGLTVAFAAFIIILIQVDYDLGYNKSFKDHDRIYRLEIAIDPAQSSFWCNVSRPLAKIIVDSSPEIEQSGEFGGGGDEISLRISDDANSSFIDFRWENISAKALELLGLKITAGDTSKFNEPNHVIISESSAEKLFPKESPIGKVVYGKQNKYTIAAIYKDLPENSFIKNGVITNLSDENINSPNEWSYPLFLKLRSKESAETVRKTILNLIYTEVVSQMGDDEMKEAFNPETSQRVRLSPIHETHFSKDVKYDSVDKGNLSTTYSLLTISILIILIAIINFINFSMASIPLNIKNINTRKILGSTNGKLRLEYTLKAVLLSLISLGLGLILVYSLKGSSFTSLLSCSIDLTAHIPLIIISVITAIITGIAAGFYPAIYSTSFAPALVLKGSFSLSPKGRRLRSLLIAFQFFISLTLIIVALFIMVQTRYMKSYNMGYITDNILTVWLKNDLARKGDLFSEKLKENPSISDVTFSDGMIISTSKMGWGRNLRGHSIYFDCFPVATNFIDFFGMKIVEGRDFNPDDKLKANGTFIFNETAVKEYEISFDDKIQGHVNEAADIVGIVKDFNFQTLQYRINPFALYIMGSNPWRPQSFSYIKLVPSADIKKSIDYIKSTIKEMSSTTKDEDINITFMDERIGKLYAKEESLGRLISAFCALSVFISILGILGLIYFETQFRKREISIRRIMGASIPSILKMLNARYIKIVIGCFILSIPISIIIIKSWLKTFSYQSPIPVWIFIVALFTILSIAVLVITLQSYRTASSNPAHSIKSE